MCKIVKEIKDVDIEERDKNREHAYTIEDALDMIGFGKYNMLLVVVCSCTLQAMGMELFGTSLVVAAAACDLRLDLHHRALLTAMPLCGVVLGGQAWGYVGDTRGRRLALVLGMGLGAVFAAAGSLAPNAASVAVLKLLSCTFSSASNSGAYTLLGESCSARSRGRAMLLCTCALMCSQASVAVFAYPILPLEFSCPLPLLGISFVSWRLLALVVSAPCALSAGLLLLFHESPKFLAARGRREEALQVLTSIYACNTGRDRDSFPVKKLVEEEAPSSEPSASFVRCVWRQTAPLFRRPLLPHTAKLFYLVVVIYMTGSGFIMWLPYIMNSLFSALQAGGAAGTTLCALIRRATHDHSLQPNGTLVEESCDASIEESTLLSTMSYGALASGANLVLSLTAGAHKRRAMMAVLAVSASSAVLLNVVAVPIAGGIFFFFFLLAALSMGILSVYFVELYPTNVRGMASCLSVMLGRFSAFLGVNAIGALLAADCEDTFYAWAGLLLSAIGVAWMLPRDHGFSKEVNKERT